ncbi:MULTISPECIES: OmpW family outer membrane protein [Psychrobacter]|jgi:outer membrane protein|uniref:Membrane protein n=1 Tax=Psychrobacter glaciei TaxID=619771 RepID=A0ABQ3GR62_9GAMM|nr:MULTISPECIES: OmpW family outer membrane protein [Psychrobacter]MBF4488557.1 outer membrane beta-barrel protein [Psychrobacter sp. N25K4-3-2]MBP3944942.1 outer membrane beta-barrel protein [Psychrobacter sp. K31L]MCH1782093.1 outer membrane beta-barrel protein [Psychrobacter glaciei]GHD27691.1 membrane protein [Psychrobacter glaciei]
MKLQSLVLVAAAFTMTTAFAVPAGTWSVAAGAHMVNPKSDNGTLADGTLSVEVDDDIRPTISGEYFFADNVGVELLAAIPFHHDITLTDADGNKIDAKTQHLPPTLSLQYHFDGYDLPMNVKPFVGVGINYTTFFKERIYLGNGNDLELDDSVGVAGHVGLDIPFAPTEAFRIDARYMDIKTDASLNGNDIGEVDISPWVYGVAFVKQF